MEVLDELNSLINAALYDDYFSFEGHCMTDEQRLFFVEALELTKKSLYLLQGKNYQLPIHILDKRDIGYQLKQLIYIVGQPEINVHIGGVPLGEGTQAFVDGLTNAYMKASQLNSIH